MIDGDDLDFAILASPVSWLGLLIVLIVLIVYISNSNECSEMSCENGKAPVLTESDCFCMEKAKSSSNERK